MHPQSFHWIWAFLFLSFTTGCTDDVVLAPVDEKVNIEWAGALREIAAPDGIRLDKLKEHRSTLEAYLGWASSHGQHSNSWGESKEDKRLAFLLNVYNAAVLHNLLRHDLPDSPDRVKVGPYQWEGAGFYWGTRYKIDKEWTTLNHLAGHDTVSRYAEPLLWMALFDGTQDAPRLRWWTQKKHRLQPQLVRAAKQFINSDRGMAWTDDTWQVNPLLIEHQKDFTDWTTANNLCEWMATYATGTRKKWLLEQQGNCQLVGRPPNRLTAAHNGQPGTGASKN